MLYFGGWYVFNGSGSTVKIEWAMVFSTIFFLEFLGASLIYNLLRKKAYNAWEYLQLTSITLFYYGVMIHALGSGDFLIGRTGFTTLIAVFTSSWDWCSHGSKMRINRWDIFLSGKPSQRLPWPEHFCTMAILWQFFGQLKLLRSWP